MITAIANTTHLNLYFIHPKRGHSSYDSNARENFRTEKDGLVTATKLGTTNKIFVAATKNFAAATKRFDDRTKNFVVVTKYFCYPYFDK